MNTWDTLLQAALVGTEKPWRLLPDDAADEPVNTLLLQAFALAAPDAPGQLLRLAGALSVCRRAGWVAPVAAAPVPAPAAVETRPLAGPDWANLLSAVLMRGPLRLQMQVLQALNVARLSVPPLLLPDVLHMGRSSVVARACVLPVLGERGRWLAAQNPPWAYACGAQEHADSDTHWQHGSLAQRRAVLLAQRAADPAKARECLAADWADLPGKDRAVLIQTLATGLQAQDEDFLTTQLAKDRAQEVRHSAADLLAALPGSAYSQRMAARLWPLVGGTADGTVEAPAQVDADWKADLIEAERPKFEALGERAWWLYQLTCRSSLRGWATHTGLYPAALVQRALASDWADALLRGWTHAVQHQPDPAWAAALLLPEAAARGGALAAVLALLPLEQREHYQMNQLAQLSQSDTSIQRLPGIIAACLLACPPQARWGLALSRQVVQVLKPHLNSAALRHDYTLRQQLPDVACALHPDALVLWVDIQRDGDETSALSEDLHLVAHVLHSRQVLAGLTQAALPA